MALARGVFVGLSCLILAALAPLAEAAFPGSNGRIVFERNTTGTNSALIHMNPDGTGETTLTSTGGSPVNRDPAWSPNGLKVAFSGDPDPGEGHPNLLVMNADNSGVPLNLTPGASDGQGNTGVDPAWSPSGNFIAYNDGGNIWVQSASTPDLRTQLTTGPDNDGFPAWSPDGAKIAFSRDANIHWINADGSGGGVLTTSPAAERWPDWSPDGSKIVYERSGQIWSMNADGTNQVALTGGCCPGEGGRDPVYSPDGTKIAFASGGFTATNSNDIFVMNSDRVPGGAAPTRLTTTTQNEFDPNWQRLSTVGYARPRAATPTIVRLVPAFSECTSANGSHGAPLDSPSCSPPDESSAFLTMHAPDRPSPYNTAANGTGSLTLKVFCTDGAVPPCTAAAGDQEDVRIELRTTDVRCLGSSGGCTAAGGTYSGKVLAAINARITDKLSGPSQDVPATLTDYPLTFGAQCAGGACNLSSSFDAIIPGLALEQKRAVWELSKVEVLDGGADGNLVSAPAPASGVCPPACAGNGGETVFLHQGLFVP